LLGCSAFAKESETLKIVNWNLLYGFNHKKSVKQGAKWIKKQAADVVALQELNGHTQAELEEVAAEWGHDHAAILKKGGFPVGLTSSQPIEVIELRVKGFHHGYLHCKTHGIHFFVVHFWPGKYWEADWILDKAAPLVERGEKVIILGDFNGNSRKDEDFLITNATLRKRDYTVVDKVEVKGFVDIVHKHDPKAKISQPSSITIPRWTKDLEELKLKRYRIDFVFADRTFAKTSHSGTISLAKEIETISDHYPVIVEFKVTKHKKPKTGDDR
jgi:endonuclease/exonuclease/phosphatase family metal-dependent hydrolase